jgi:hypothetical protein
MSFWNEDNYKVRVVDFVERFTAHNTAIKLYTEHYFINEEGMPVHDYIQIWKGMDWQITEGYADSDYFKVHTDVLPCPYSEANVVKTMNIGHVATTSEEVSLIIEV